MMLRQDIMAASTGEREVLLLSLRYLDTEESFLNISIGDPSLRWKHYLASDAVNTSLQT